MYVEVMDVGKKAGWLYLLSVKECESVCVVVMEERRKEGWLLLILTLRLFLEI